MNEPLATVVAKMTSSVHLLRRRGPLRRGERRQIDLTVAEMIEDAVRLLEATAS